MLCMFSSPFVGFIIIFLIAPCETGVLTKCGAPLNDTQPTTLCLPKATTAPYDNEMENNISLRIRQRLLCDAPPTVAFHSNQFHRGTVDTEVKVVELR